MTNADSNEKQPPPERELLDRAVDSVADSIPVDWPALLAEFPALAPTLRRLRALERLGSMYRVHAVPVANVDAETGIARPDSPRDLPPLFVWGHLHVLEKLGGGTFGEIYRAFDPVLRREVALKLAREVTADTVPVASGMRHAAGTGLDEARRMARIRHPNVLAVHGADIQNGRVGIWTDLLRGRTLEERLRAEGPMTAQQTALVGLDLCRALTAIHSAGVLHGDVKAANVMQEESGAIVLLDLGSGHDLGSPATSASITGTPLVLAPEVLRGEPQTMSSDLHALGVLLYRITTGRYPVVAASLAELVAKQEAGAGAALRDVRPDLPLAFVRVVERALAPREQRFASAGEMERELADALLAMAAPTSEKSTSRSPLPGTLHATPVESDTWSKRDIPTNLPVLHTRFIGRAHALRNVRELIRRRRLVTMTGAGGAGKTRLAIESVRRLRRRFADGIWFVELAPVADPEDVIGAVARAIGFEAEPGVPWEEQLFGHLSKRRVLLVLDNCEHLRSSAADLASDLLDRCNRVHVLATSREDLGVTGETIIQVPAMPIPACQVLAPADLSRVESVRLFVDRAQTVHSSFVLNEETAASVAKICRHLDGLPLALELAAARVRTFSVEEIAARLDDRFALLADRSEAGTEDHLRADRHQTLDALIDWSYGLLPRGERTLFRRLAVFAGGFTLGAAEYVGAGGVAVGEDMVNAGVMSEDVVGFLANLVGKSLVERDGRARYRLLETVRQFARERCLDEGEWGVIGRRHRDFFLRFAEEAALHLRGADPSTWLARLAADHDNLRSAIDAFVGEDPDLESALRMANALAEYFWQRGRWREARTLYERVLAHPGATGTTPMRAAVLVQLANLAHAQGRGEEARALAGDALAIRRQLGDRAGTAVSLRKLGSIAVDSGELAEARRLLEESIDLERQSDGHFGLASAIYMLGWVDSLEGRFAKARLRFEECLGIQQELGNEWGISSALRAIGGVQLALGDAIGARAQFERSLELARKLDAPVGVASCLHDLGIVSMRLHDLELARHSLEESLALFQSVGDVRGEGRAFEVLAQVAIARGDLAGAQMLLLDSLRITQRVHDHLCLPQVLSGLGRVAIAAGDPGRAVRLLGAGEGARERMGAVLEPDLRRDVDQAFEMALRLLDDEDEAKRITNEWRAKPIAEVLVYAASAIDLASLKPSSTTAPS